MLAFLFDKNIFDIAVTVFSRASIVVSKLILSIFVLEFLGVTDLGKLGLLAGATVVAPVLFGVGFVADICRRFNRCWRVLLSNLLAFWSGLVLFYVFVFGFVFCYFVFFGSGVSEAWVGLLAVAVIFSEHVNQDSYQALIAKGRVGGANLVLLLRNVLWVFSYCSAAYFVEWLRDFYWLLIFWLTGSLFTFFVFVFISGINARVARFVLCFPRWVKSRLLVFRYFYVYEVFCYLSQYIDRYLIAIFLGAELTGVYVLFWQLSNAVYNMTSSAILHANRYRFLSTGASDFFAFKSLLISSCIKLSGFFVVQFVFLVLIFYLGVGFLSNPLVGDYVFLLVLLMFVVLFRLFSEAFAQAFYVIKNDGFMAASSAINFILLAAFVFFVLFLGFGIYAVAWLLIANHAIVLLVRFFKFILVFK